MKAAYLATIVPLVACCHQPECAAEPFYEALISTSDQLLPNDPVTLSIDTGVLLCHAHAHVMHSASYIGSTRCMVEDAYLPCGS